MFCRLLKHMDKTGTRYCLPNNSDASVEKTPFLDMRSGYIQRALGPCSLSRFKSTVAFISKLCDGLCLITLWQVESMV